MLNNPIYILAVLVGIEAAILILSGHPRTSGFFKYLPSMFWIYFTPMVVSTCKLIPAQSPVYSAITTWCLPASLVLLLLCVDMRAIMRLGALALAVMAVACAGIMAGACAVTCIYRHWLPEEAWKAIGALSASWTGGSANMIAVAGALDTPNSVYFPAMVVDTIVPYLWMGILIAGAAYQAGFDRWNKSRTILLHELSARAQNAASVSVVLSPGGMAMIAPVALAGSGICVVGAHFLPEIKGFANGAAWIVIIATFLGLALSFTPARRLESAGVSRVGFWLLYLVLASIGAKANLGALTAAPVFLAAGLTWVAIHGIILLAAGRILRAPLALLASASQAAVGGVASAPVVAGIYNAQLAPVGLLLAILGNILGTFLGLATAHLCRMVW